MLQLGSRLRKHALLELQTTGQTGTSTHQAGRQPATGCVVRVQVAATSRPCSDATDVYSEGNHAGA